jgi:hypothetical protein
MNAITQKPDQVAAIPASKVTELDVRPILRSGGEPFGKIMAAVASTPLGGAIRLRATFRPTPLFAVLGKQGWQNWVEFGEGDDWIIWFYKDSSGAAPEQVPADELKLARLRKDHPELQKRLTTEGGMWLLDVRRMSPPEPLELTLSVLEKLPRGTTLIQINERVPQFLLPLLEERGLRHEIVRNDETEVRIRIEPAG